MKRLTIILLGLLFVLEIQAQSKIGRMVHQDAFVATTVTADAAATIGGVAKTFYDILDTDFNVSVAYGVTKVSGTADGKIYIQASNDNTNWTTISTISLSDATTQAGDAELTTWPYKYLRLYYDEVTAASVDIRAYIIGWDKK